jgi:uncharacterized protein HemX
MDALKKHWKALLVVAVVAALGVGYTVYTKVFVKDAAFVAEQQKLQEQRDRANEALGVGSAEDDFDELKAPEDDKKPE